jgi:hypothetical protein
MIEGRITAVLVVAFVFTGGLVMHGSTSGSPVALPESVSGWGAAADTVYTRESIYGYIDGGAELYLSYGFASLYSRTYTREGRPDIIVDVFDMAEPRNAFGVFSHSRETIDDAFGQGSQYTRGLLVFWKDRYYVSILTSPETDESRKAVFELARRIDEVIPEEGSLPGILELLPAESLVEESIRYFRHHVWLNSHYYVSGDNIFHIDESTEAVLAKYRSDDERCFLLVVDYPDEARALGAQEEFVTQYLPEAGGETLVRIEDSTWVGYRRVGTVLSVVFNGPTDRAVDALLADVQERVARRRSAEGRDRIQH